MCAYIVFIQIFKKVVQYTPFPLYCPLWPYILEMGSESSVLLLMYVQ
jgi:hypothetical protein